MAGEPIRSVIADDRKFRVFLSYSRKDLIFAENLHQALETQGYDVLMDRTDIAAGEDWRQRLGRLIGSADTVVFAVSPSSVSSEICGWEVAEAERLGKRILPAVVAKADDRAIPEALSRLNFIFFENKDFGQALVELTQALEIDLPWLREHTRLGELAHSWRARGSSIGGVLRGRDLEEAERWIASPPRNAGVATDIQRDFIAQSRKAATKRQRNWIGGILGILLVSLGLTIWSEVNRRNADARRKEVEIERDRASQILNRASTTSNEMVINLAQRFRSQRGSSNEVVWRILQRAQQLQDDLLEFSEKDAYLRESSGTAALEVAETLRRLGSPKGDLDAVNKAIATFEGLTKEDPENGAWQHALAKTYMSMSDHKASRGDFSSARDWLKLALSIISNRILLVNSDNELRLTISKIHRKLALSYLRIGYLDPVADHLAVSMRLVDQLLPEDRPRIGTAADIREDEGLPDSSMGAQVALPVHVLWMQEKARVFEAYGDLYLKRNDMPRSVESYSIAMQVFHAIHLTDIQNNTEFRYDLWRSSTKVGDAAAKKGDLFGAVAINKFALGLSEKLKRENFDNPELERPLTVSNIRLGNFMKARGDQTEAISYYKDALVNAKDIWSRRKSLRIWQYDIAVAEIKLATMGGEFLSFEHEARMLIKELRRETRLSYERSTDGFWDLDVPVEPILPE